MYTPPRDPNDRSPWKRRSWRSLIAGYAVIPVVLLALWALSHPLAGAVALTVVVGSVLGARRARRLVRCFRDCGGFAIDLAGTVRITIARAHADDPS